MPPNQAMPPQQPVQPQQPAQPPTPPIVTGNMPPTGPQPLSANSASAEANMDYPVKLSVLYPDKQSRGLGLLGIIGIRGLLLLPHVIVLYFLLIGSSIAAFINFFIILFTGKSSQGMHKFIVGTLRWSTRISAYSLGLTDKYPPFSLSD